MVLRLRSNFEPDDVLASASSGVLYCFMTFSFRRTISDSLRITSVSLIDYNALFHCYFFNIPVFVLNYDD